MNPRTGEIRRFPKHAPGGWIELDRPPDPGCKRCFGRGYEGRDAVAGAYVPCRCVLRSKRTRIARR